MERAATVWERFAARLIDGVILGVAFSIIWSIIGAAIASGGPSAVTFWAVSGLGIVVAVVDAVASLAYFALLESRQGATLGKRLLGMRVEGPAGQPPPLEATIRRNAWMLLPIIPVLGGLAALAVAIYIGYTIANDAEGLGWHDRLAGTRVLRTA